MQSSSASIVFAALLHVAKSDLCLDLPNGDWSSGNQLQAYDCTGADSQKFYFDENGWLVHESSGKCVDGGALASGSPLMLWDCNDEPQQQFGGDSGFIYASGSKDASLCLEITSVDAGARVQLWDCDTTRPQQYWTDDSSNKMFFANNDIHAISIYAWKTGDCWDIPGGQAGNGQVIQLGQCQGSSNQGWMFSGDTIVTGQDFNMCLDLPNNDKTNGIYLQLWECASLPQQQWGIDPITGYMYLASSEDASKCIAYDKKDDKNHLMIWDCNEGNSQIFAFGGQSGLSKSISV